MTHDDTAHAQPTEAEREEAELAEIQRAWTGWSIWRSSGGSWCATRKGDPLSRAQISQDLANTLMEPDAKELKKQLAHQAALAKSLS